MHAVAKSKAAESAPSIPGRRCRWRRWRRYVLSLRGRGHAPLLVVVVLVVVVHVDVSVFFFFFFVAVVVVVVPLALDRGHRRHSAVERALRHVVLAVSALLLGHRALLVTVMLMVDADVAVVVVSGLSGILF